MDDQQTSPPLSVAQTFGDYLDMKSTSRSANTSRTYRNALNYFAEILREHGFEVETHSPADLCAIAKDALIWLIDETNATLRQATERLYTSVVSEYFKYLSAEEICQVNLAKVQMLIQQRTRRENFRIPQFNRDNIERVIEYAMLLKHRAADNEIERLRDLRNRALIVTLADTGLRIHEACALTRGSLDMNAGVASVVGKGRKPAFVRFSPRAIEAIQLYLKARTQILDGKTGKQLTTLPIFARHDKGAGKAVKPMTMKTGREIVDEISRSALGDDDDGTITPHSFRHYFVTVVLMGTGNMKMAQDLARHSNIQTTQGYVHIANKELDQGYEKVFGNKPAA